MDNLKYINNFLEIGLTEREAKIYLSLVRKKMCSAFDLQAELNISRSKIYELLQKMINRGICIERRYGRNKIFEAVEPKIAFERILENYHLELNRKARILTKLSETLSSAYNKSTDVINPLNYIDILNDRDLIHRKYISLLKSTKKEMLTFNKMPYACNDNDKKIKEQNINEINMLKEGKSSKAIYETDELTTIDWLYETNKTLIDEGLKAKTINNLPVKMIVFDNKAVMFALDKLTGISDELTMVSIEHSGIADACKILFYHVWEQSEGIDIYT